MPSSEDFAKYFCALGSRSARRVAAKVYAAADLDADTRVAMLEELTCVLDVSLPSNTLMTPSQ